MTQENHYDPWGVAIEQEVVADKTKLPNFELKDRFTYNGKELQGTLNYLDYGARMYDATIGRWGAVDDLSELVYEQSPFQYTLNNPFNLIDPLGMAAEKPENETKKINSFSPNRFESTHTDNAGNVLMVVNDGDNGVYRHGIGVTLADILKKYSSANTSAGGERMGETQFWDEFAPEGIIAPKAKILFNQSWEEEFEIMREYASNLSLLELKKQQQNGGIIDIKSYNRPFIGKLFRGKYISTRSLGNYTAGFTGHRSTLFGGLIGLNFGGYMRLAGYYNQHNELPLVIQKRLVVDGWTPYPPPYYGEAPYSGRMIVEGWTDAHSGRKDVRK